MLWENVHGAAVRLATYCPSITRSTRVTATLSVAATETASVVPVTDADVMLTTGLVESTGDALFTVKPTLLDWPMFSLASYAQASTAVPPAHLGAQESAE